MDISALVRVTGLRQALQLAIDFATSVAVARLLTPGEIGVFSVAMAAVALATALRGGNVGTYLIQVRHLTPASVGGALGFAISVSAAIAVTIVLVRHPIARFYGAPAMSEVLLLVAASVALAPVQGVAAGLLMRELRFGRVSAVELTASLLGAATTLTLAQAGTGPVAMAWGGLVFSLAAACLYLLAAPAPFWSRPRFLRWRPVAATSGWLMGVTVVQTIGQSAGELVLGRTLGLAAAALFDRANTLPRMAGRHLLPPLLAVLTPVVARELRDGADVRVVTLRRMRFLGWVLTPVLAGMATQAEHLILVIYGSQWSAAIGPARWLCLAMAVSVQFTVIASTLMAQGRARDVFLAQLVQQGGRIAAVFALGWTTIEAVAIGFLVVQFAYAAAMLALAQRRGILARRDLGRALGPALFAGLAALAVGTATDVALARLAPLSHLASLAVAIAVLAAMLAAILALREPDVLRFALKVLLPRRIAAR